MFRVSSAPAALNEAFVRNVQTTHSTSSTTTDSSTMMTDSPEETGLVWHEATVVFRQQPNPTPCNSLASSTSSLRASLDFGEDYPDEEIVYAQPQDEIDEDPEVTALTSSLTTSLASFQDGSESSFSRARQLHREASLLSSTLFAHAATSSRVIQKRKAAGGGMGLDEVEVVAEAEELEHRKKRSK